MKDVKLLAVRAGTGFFALIAIATGIKQLYNGAVGALGDTAAGLATAQELAGLDNDLRFLAMGWLIIGIAMAVGALLPRRYPDFILLGLSVVVFGGFARLYGFTEFGPIPGEYAPIAIEFIIGTPLLIMHLLWRRQPESE